MDDKMIINRETALRIWALRYGKQARVADFAGRVMERTAYGNRGSKFGWNLDHIFPESKGGKTADHNLICCHILTNDEKADKTSFKANGQAFEVVKVLNHYEIRKKGSDGKTPEYSNLFDAAYGIRLFKKLCSSKASKGLRGEILISFDSENPGPILDFIGEVFYSESIRELSRRPSAISYSGRPCPSMVLIASSNVRPESSQIQGLLDKCILLNTYIQCYFMPTRCVFSYDIRFQMLEDSASSKSFANRDYIDWAAYATPENCVQIDDRVIESTDAAQKFPREDSSRPIYLAYPVKMDGLKKYDVVYKQLSDDLRKEVNTQE